MIAMTGLVLEALVAVLLIVTIIYCVLLDRRIRSFKADQLSLAGLVAQLSNATEHAETAVAGLKSTAEEADGELDGKLKKARSLSEELAFMVETGNNLAGKLADPAQRGMTSERQSTDNNVAYLKTAARRSARPEKTEPAFARPAGQPVAAPVAAADEDVARALTAASGADQRIRPPLRNPAAPARPSEPAAVQGRRGGVGLAQALRYAR